MFNEILFPNVRHDNWQMMPWEKIALTGVLSRVKPKGAIEIGVYHGGSLSLAAPFCQKIIAIDIDPEVPNRFAKPDNAELWIAPSSEAVPAAFAQFEAQGIPVNYILIDADHSAEGVRRDIELILDYTPREPLFVLMHDSGNPETRRGIWSADWGRNPHLHFLDLDFVPGQIIEHAVAGNHAEVWGGLAIAYFDPAPRTSEAVAQQSARTSIRCLHACAPDLSKLPIP